MQSGWSNIIAFFSSLNTGGRCLSWPPPHPNAPQPGAYPGGSVHSLLASLRGLVRGPTWEGPELFCSCHRRKQLGRGWEGSRARCLQEQEHPNSSCPEALTSPCRLEAGSLTLAGPNCHDAMAQGPRMPSLPHICQPTDSSKGLSRAVWGGPGAPWEASPGRGPCPIPTDRKLTDFLCRLPFHRPGLTAWLGAVAGSFPRGTSSPAQPFTKHHCGQVLHWLGPAGTLGSKGQSSEGQDWGGRPQTK